jgi:hypothetical protein
MLIKASKHTAQKAAWLSRLVDFHPGPVLIGTVQFTANDGMEDQQREEEALELLANHSAQAARHPVLFRRGSARTDGGW